MGNFVRSSQNVNIEVSKWQELKDYNYKKMATNNDGLSLQKFFEDKFGADLEEVLMAGDIIHNHIKRKSKADFVEIDFLCKSEIGYLSIDSPYYFFAGEESWQDANDPGTIRSLYSVSFPFPFWQPPEIHKWKSEIIKD